MPNQIPYVNEMTKLSAENGKRKKRKEKKEKLEIKKENPAYNIRKVILNRYEDFLLSRKFLRAYTTSENDFHPHYHTFFHSSTNKSLTHLHLFSTILVFLESPKGREREIGERNLAVIKQNRELLL